MMITLSLPADTPSDSLLAHWDALNAEYAEIVTKLAVVTYQIEEV